MTTTPARPTPLDVIRTAAAVITARGYYQPASRQWEQMVPTVMDVEALLNGHALLPRTRAGFERAAAQLDERQVLAVLQWCLSATPDASPYRLKLARAATATHADPRDVGLLCSAYPVWLREQERAARAAQGATDSARSRHQGTVGQRLTATATVATVTEQPSKAYAYTTQARYLIKFRTTEGHILIWEARPRTSATLPQRGDQVEVTGKVVKHSTYTHRHHGPVAQTYLSHCKIKTDD
ncbi:hypothetical protein [Streptomyces alboflavus]|uniref:hypothetical protein n=1 Tax=Streptomyces alboflavus TaxID=67267 RepID=UPI000F6584F8|nr:hypothetical protein [Streptomyces alboflavus]